MKFVALVSGGKDSFYNIHNCLSLGHELIAFGNLYPLDSNKDEIDSFMFQTVGHDIIDYYSKCLEVPLYRRAIHAKSSINQNLEYEVTENDEIEDLYKLIHEIKLAHPDVQGVSCGAILSHYQRTRVENVCDRLGLTSSTYLWQRNQYDLMNEMCLSGLDARIIKVAAIGLGAKHLGKSIQELFPTLVKLNQMYDVHICGEGGEFETIVLNCKFFKRKKLQVQKQEVVDHSNDNVCYLKMQVELVDKEPEEFAKIEPPALLEDEFEELLHIQTQSTDIKGAQSIKPITPKANIVSTSTKLYISNLTSTKESIEDQVKDIFTILKAHLNQYNLTNNDIQHITLLVKDMDDFTAINKTYSSQFQNIYLPPSRICVETNINTNIQASFIVLRNIQPKNGIHIRSRSYWGPQNIGPYSQSIIDKQESYKLASLSGQIPLIPSTMELSTESSLYNSVLSLQHLHRVKNLVGVKNFASVICFITGYNDLGTVSSVWNDYISDVDSSSSPPLTVVKVSNLPRNANVEWGGFSYENIIDMYEDEEDEVDFDDSRYAKFDDVSRCSIGKGKLQIIHLFTSDSNLIKELETDQYAQLICNPNDFIPINADYLSVESVFNKDGKQFKYCLILKLET
ncbi:unnamed protein product [Candida verbasci]|uniref:Diphthine--ammonia ligase n=1 Tax=Candida verbasci TaxID=1227364 RepID=A0A9W4TRX4_9ASCO|nr:unnamed protein product [Candida verbasci]